MSDDMELGAEWDAIPEDTNILLTHSPSYGVLDHVDHSYGRDPNVGSKSLAERLLALQGSLKLHVCGHIHCDSGVVVGNTHTTINAAVLNDAYRLSTEPIIHTLA